MVAWQAIPPLALGRPSCPYASTVFPKSLFITYGARNPQILLFNWALIERVCRAYSARMAMGFYPALPGRADSLAAGPPGLDDAVEHA